MSPTFWEKSQCCFHGKRKGPQGALPQIPFPEKLRRKQNCLAQETSMGLGKAGVMRGTSAGPPCSWALQTLSCVGREARKRKGRKPEPESG